MPDGSHRRLKNSQQYVVEERFGRIQLAKISNGQDRYASSLPGLSIIFLKAGEVFIPPLTILTLPQEDQNLARRGFLRMIENPVRILPRNERIALADSLKSAEIMGLLHFRHAVTGQPKLYHPLRRENRRWRIDEYRPQP